MLQQENFHSIHPGDVRNNTHYVHLAATPSAAWQFNCRLHPHRGIKGAETALLCVWGSRY